jgi:hypothetical protein
MRAKDAPHVRVEGETAQQIAHLWRQLPPDEQMRCHMPPFGLRFYVENKLLVQGSVCWECNNIFVEENGEELIYEFNGKHKHSLQLFILLKKIKIEKKIKAFFKLFGDFPFAKNRKNG